MVRPFLDSHKGANAIMLCILVIEYELYGHYAQILPLLCHVYLNLKELLQLFNLLSGIVRQHLLVQVLVDKPDLSAVEYTFTTLSLHHMYIHYLILQ